MYGWEVRPERGEGGNEAVAMKLQSEVVEEALEPVLQFQAHADAVNGIR